MKQVVVNLHQTMEEAGYVYGTDWQQNAMIHDEIEISCPPKYVENIKEIALAAFPAAQQFFGFRAPIEGDAKVGYTWCDVH